MDKRGEWQDVSSWLEATCPIGSDPTPTKTTWLALGSVVEKGEDGTLEGVDSGYVLPFYSLFF